MNKVASLIPGNSFQRINFDVIPEQKHNRITPDITDIHSYCKNHKKKIVKQNLLRDLKILCKDPVLSIRDAATPEYRKSAEFVANELCKAGVEPLGDIVNGKRTFFQDFRWEEAEYAPGTIGKTCNIVGIIPGKGKEPREAVLLIAHLDNLSSEEKEWYKKNEGLDLSQYEGANDNTAAVVTLLEAAKALKNSGNNKRDIIFLIPSAEEDGLKGTEAFVMAPPVSLDRIIGAINLEMIGRNHVKNIFIYGAPTETEANNNHLYNRAIRVAKESRISIKPGLGNDNPKEDWWTRSDHLVTYNAGIPSIMLHGGTDPNGYHNPLDKMENLNIKKLQITGKMVVRLVRDLANDLLPKERRGTPKPHLNPDNPGQVWPGSV